MVLWWRIAGLKCKALAFLINSFIKETKIQLCGCAAASSPADLFPPLGTPLACLSTGPATTMTKRVQVYSQNIGDSKVTCNTDNLGNPFQDCLNAMVAVCDPSYINKNGKNNCRYIIDNLAWKASTFWFAYRKYCGQWLFDGVVGSTSLSECSNAELLLVQNAYYNSRTGPIYVTTDQTASWKEFLWNNQALK